MKDEIDAAGICFGAILVMAVVSFVTWTLWSVL